MIPSYILAFLISYYFSYSIINKGSKFRQIKAFIFSLIVGLFFIWHSIKGYISGILFSGYALASLAVLGNVILLFKDKRVASAIISFLPFVFSALIMWFYIDMNVNAAPCLPEEGCMNETGMIAVFSLMILGFAVFINIITHLFDRLSDSKKPNERYKSKGF